MRKLPNFIILIILAAFFSGCSQENGSKLEGAWIAEQADQVIGTEEEITHYNYLEFSEKKVLMKSFVYDITDDKMEKKFDSSEVEKNYELQANNQIVIDNKTYELDVKKSEMIIRNENATVYYTIDKGIQK